MSHVAVENLHGLEQQLAVLGLNNADGQGGGTGNTPGGWDGGRNNGFVQNGYHDNRMNGGPRTTVAPSHGEGQGGGGFRGGGRVLQPGTAYAECRHVWLTTTKMRRLEHN
nr:glycine-rich RNA-binding, abscisic acid-inducible protein-like [Salvelinus alpinus]